MKALTTEEFIKKAKKIHHDKYDYSKTIYKNAHTKVCIICPKHGEFWQEPANHLLGRGCYLCGREESGKKQTMPIEEFISKAKKVHGDKYDYSKAKYGKNNEEKICIICPEHGEFWQTPADHLKGNGCSKCGRIKTLNSIRLTTEKFVEKAKNIHGDKYDYSKVVYKGNKEKVCIICPKHGEFWQFPSNHLSGKGCFACRNELNSANNTSSTEEFIEKAKIVHGDKYDYSKVDYKSAKEKVCIICPEHGEFWQRPTNHLSGFGCPMCFKGKSSKELKLKNDLEKDFINEEIIYQARPNWLKGQTFDFYFPKHNLAIEYQGEQHFFPIKLFGGEEQFKKNLSYDKRKNFLSTQNKCKILYFSYKKYDEIKNYPFVVLTDYNELKEEIKKYI